MIDFISHVIEKNVLKKFSESAAFSLLIAEIQSGFSK